MLKIEQNPADGKRFLITDGEDIELECSLDRHGRINLDWYSNTESDEYFNEHWEELEEQLQNL